jgi:hypothetical protein
MENELIISQSEQSPTEPEPNPKFKASKFIQPLHLTSLIFLAVSITSLTYFNIRKSEEIKNLKQLVKDTSIVKHDTIPDPTFLIVKSFQIDVITKATSTTFKSSGTLTEWQDTIKIEGILLSMLRERFKQHLIDKKGKNPDTQRTIATSTKPNQNIADTVKLTKDTLRHYKPLVNLLVISKRLYENYKKKNYSPIYADSLFNINSQMTSLLNDNGSFFTSAITKQEIDTLKDYFDRWNKGYKVWDRKPGTQVKYEGKTFPTYIADKINKAYLDYNKLVGDR